MDFKLPNKTGFVIYSKNECIFCLKVKTLLNQRGLDFNEINCDEYILRDKSCFLSFMSKMSMQTINTFPVVFYNNHFIGGYNETARFVEKLQVNFD
jgi:glutaredoxin